MKDTADKNLYFFDPKDLYRSLFIILAVVALALAFNFSYYYFNRANTVTVTGKSTSTTSNQVAKFSATVSKEDSDKQVAVKAATDSANALIEEIKKFGIDAKDLKTNSINVYQLQEPYMEDGVQKYRPGNWNASITVDVTLRDVSKASEFAGVLAAMNTTNLYGPNFSVDNRQVDEAGILSEAVSDAKQKASALAAKSGRRLGAVVSITEGYSPVTPLAGVRYDMAVGMGGGAGIPAEPGSTDVTKFVTVTYRLY